MKSTIFLYKKWFSFFVKRENRSNTRISPKRASRLPISEEYSFGNGMSNPFPIDSTVAVVIWAEKGRIDCGISSDFFCEVFCGFSSEASRGGYYKMFSIKNYFDNSDRFSSSFFNHELLIGMCRRYSCPNKGKQQKKSDFYFFIHYYDFLIN